jgi:protein-arginine kinase
LISRIGFTRNNTSKHNVLYTKENVDKLIDKVLHAKTVLKKNDQERHLLKKFDAMQVSGMQKLIRRQLNEGNLIPNTIFYLKTGS